MWTSLCTFLPSELNNLNRLLIPCFDCFPVFQSATSSVAPVVWFFAWVARTSLGVVFQRPESLGVFGGGELGNIVESHHSRCYKLVSVLRFCLGWKIYDMTLGILGNLPTLPMEMHDSPENVRFTGLGENQQGITSPLNFRVCYVPL